MFDLFCGTQLREAALKLSRPLREPAMKIPQKMLEGQWMSRSAIKNEGPAEDRRPFGQRPGRRIDTNDDVAVHQLFFGDTVLESQVSLEHYSLLIESGPQEAQCAQVDEWPSAEFFLW